MARQFTSAEWDIINARLEADPERYGLPQREYGSTLLGSFNIRKLGSSRSRSPDTWEFLANVCRSFDLLAVQEVMDDLSGLRRLMSHSLTETPQEPSTGTGDLRNPPRIIRPVSSDVASRSSEWAATAPATPRS